MATKRKRSAKKAKRVAPACQAKRAAIGKIKGKGKASNVRRGKALAAFLACQRAHGIKPRKARRRGRK